MARRGYEYASRVSLLNHPDAAHRELWQEIHDGAERRYDRSSDCGFTISNAYEYTEALDCANIHRNVIFRNQPVTATEISAYATDSMNHPELPQRLRRECIGGSQGCDVIAIPHNLNLLHGKMFPDPRMIEEARAVGSATNHTGVDPAQEPFNSPALQERAWTSPIGINPVHQREA